MDRLQEKYINEVVPAMTEKFGYKNVMQLPKIEKVIISRVLVKLLTTLKHRFCCS